MCERRGRSVRHRGASRTWHLDRCCGYVGDDRCPGVRALCPSDRNWRTEWQRLSHITLTLYLYRLFRPFGSGAQLGRPVPCALDRPRFTPPLVRQVGCSGVCYGVRDRQQGGRDRHSRPVATGSAAAATPHTWTTCRLLCLTCSSIRAADCCPSRALVGVGYPEVQALRLVFRGLSLSQVARRNGCHLQRDNDRLAKAMLGHVCFDAAIQLAARVLKAEWAVCGGYALSCQMSASAPHPRKVPVR